MVNHLVSENSPYLLQHKNNPVDWYPWGKLALDKAKQEEKPIFLSIGYAACHWCHVMAHESFEDQETAAIMNRYFVCIKVDREERPDLDNIYMNSVVAMTGQGGWPMSVFLTPDGQPFYGGTYFPPTQRYNMPAFRDVLLSVARVWTEDRERIYTSSDQITKQIQVSNTAFGDGIDPLSKASLDGAALTLAQSYDWEDGGWGKAPKFPQPMAIEFLLRRATHGDRFALEVAVHALKAMAKGGMFDVVGGGFARYSTDNHWLVPHFEKMLYDNAQLANVYLHAYLITGEEQFRQVCESTLDFVAREMTDPSGGFYSSLDADSEGEEGKFYLWTDEEIQDVLKDPDDYELFRVAYGITKSGNFDGSMVLQRVTDDSTLVEKLQLPLSEVMTKLTYLHDRLLKTRNRRVRPETDDKALTAWNALMLLSFSEAARYLDREDYLLMAIRNGRFLSEKLLIQGQLFRSWRAGQVSHKAYLEDYAAMIVAMISLYQTDPDLAWFRTALGLVQDMLDHFRDPAGGFFDTHDDQGNLIIRPKDIQDNAIPSGNALAASALLYLSSFQGSSEWYDLAEKALRQVQDVARKFPLAFSQWLCAIDFAVSPRFEIAILGDLDLPETQSLRKAVWSQYRPNLINATSTYPPPADSPALFDNRPLINNRPTMYVCQSFVCKQPINTPKEFLEQFDSPTAN